MFMRVNSRCARRDVPTTRPLELVWPESDPCRRWRALRVATGAKVDQNYGRANELFLFQQRGRIGPCRAACGPPDGTKSRGAEPGEGHH
jgi:hypothetical protein